MQIGLVDHLIAEPLIPSAGNDFCKPHRRGGQCVAPVEAVQRHGGIVGDVLEVIADGLGRRDLFVAAFVDRNIGVYALI